VNHQDRRSMAYWLTLAFRLEREPRRAINGLVLTADRKTRLGLIDLVRMNATERPAEIAKYAPTLDRLLEAEGKVSAQAFVVDRLLSLGCQVIPITDPMYPPHLARRIGPDRSPTVLTVMGSPEIWRSPGVAISGSRKSGPSGLAFAREAGRAVATAGEVVVCGLAAGVDREALEGALEAGGRVLGISPEGLFHSRWARRREVSEGRLAVVSEFAPDDRWSAGRAMARNRTIAGFSSALVIADCVASGGTTDQLEVHRAAGLQIFVRRGPGQGAIVDELCRRPGVTPWDWQSGPVVWPHAVVEGAAEVVKPVRPTVNCIVTLSHESIEIRVEAPRQLSFDAVLETIGAEYRRAIDNATEYTIPEATNSHRVSEGVSTYGARSTDPVLAALTRAAAAGATTREVEQSSGESPYRVKKRLNELLDARLISKLGHRYYDASVKIETAQGAKKRAGRKQAAPAAAQTLFSNFDLRADRGRS
jgi:DNA recombination-mediator protein A